MSAKQPVPETPKPKGSKLPDQKDFLAWWRGAANCRNSDQCCKLLGVLYRNGSPVVTEGEIKRILRPERETSKGLESERKYLEKPVRKLNKRLRDLLNVPITEPALVQSGYLDDIKGYKLDVNRLLSLIPEDELQILQGVEIPKRSIFTVGESAEVQSTPFIILAGAGALQYIKLHLTEANAYIENGGEIRVLFVLSDIQIAVSLADALNFKIQGEDQPERNIHFLVIKGKQLVPGTYAIRQCLRYEDLKSFCIPRSKSGPSGPNQHPLDFVNEVPDQVMDAHQAVWASSRKFELLCVSSEFADIESDKILGDWKAQLGKLKNARKPLVRALDNFRIKNRSNLA